MPHCSIVIRAFNEEDHIGRLMEGIHHQSFTDHEIILVDSGSSDRTVSIAKQYGARVVSIQPHEFTFGFSLNKGIEAATGQIIVIASAHVYPVYPDWLERMVKVFEDPQIALCYGKQRGMETTSFSEHQIFSKWFPNDASGIQSHPFCNNANAAIRRELWEHRKYNESLTGLEDLDWAKWVVEHGFKIHYDPDATIIHVHDEPPGVVKNRYQREAMAFKQIYPDENFSILDFIRLTLTNIISDCTAAQQSRMLLTKFREIMSFRVNQFWGTYLGYKHSSLITTTLRTRFYYPNTSFVEEDSTRDIEPIDYNKG